MHCSTLFVFALAAVTHAGRLSTRQDDAQKSKTLLDNQIQDGIKNNDDGEVEAGQVNSETSPNNFINYCATKDLPLTNGKQVKTGSCNPTIMGVILATDRLPSCKFVEPANLGTVKSNTNFTISLKVKNLSTGFFVNPATKYFGAPSNVNNDGFLIAHSHVTVNKIASLDTTEVGEALDFAFFKGLNGKADDNGVLSTVVAGGLPEGDYRACSINTAANHQPVLGSVAQHASFDDCIYFSATASGDDSDNEADAPQGNGNGNGNGVGSSNGKGSGGKGSGSNAGNGASSNGSGRKGDKAGSGKDRSDGKSGSGKQNNGSKGGDKAKEDKSAAENARCKAKRLRRRAAHKRSLAAEERLRRQRRA